MAKVTNSESSVPALDKDEASIVPPEPLSVPAGEPDAEATLIGPPSDESSTPGSERPGEQKLETILEKFSQSLVAEQQDLDQTLAETSLKPASGQEKSGTSSLLQSGSLRPRKLQSTQELSANAGPVDFSHDYVTLDKLGEGGMGTVHLARQVALKRDVALKQIHHRSSRQSSVRDEFLTEAVLTGKLEHPNIVPIYEVGESEGGDLFYAMKNVKGRVWDSTIDELSLTENLEILIDVCDAIAFAHAEGVIHRDLKPQNIMTGGFGEVLVLDWGLAVLASSGGDVTTSAGGTPSYMAPEMINPPFQIGPRSDVYLLGAILFRFLTGQVPHTGKSARASLEAVSKNEIVEPDPERLQEQDPTGELLSVALKAMNTDPADRYQTVSDFQQGVRDFVAHRESLTLATRAEEALQSAEQSGEYTQYSRSMIGFEEAVTLWSGNQAAQNGIERARQVYALCAERKEDYELGLSLLDESVPEQRDAIQRLTAARDERNARRGRLRRLKQGLLAAAALIFVILGGAALWINNERVEANRQRELAQTNEQRAQSALARQLQAERARRQAEQDERVAQARSLRQATPQAAALLLTELDFESPEIQDELRSQLSDSSLTAEETNRIRLALLKVDPEQLAPIVDFVKSEMVRTSSPKELQLVRSQLISRDMDLKAQLEPMLSDPTQRLFGACLLAGLVVDGNFWPQHTTGIADDLVRVNPMYLGTFQSMLQPVAEPLIPALTRIFAAPDSSELSRNLATSLLAEYAANDTKAIVNLILAADPVSDRTLFPLLQRQKHQSVAVDYLENILDEQLSPQWHDAPPDPKWTKPLTEIRAQMESAHGVLGERFAFCLNMPLSRFLKVSEALRPCGYRPTRVRPHRSLVLAPTASDEEATGARTAVPDWPVAAVWMRDGGVWQIQHGLTAEELPAVDVSAEKDGLLPQDVSALPAFVSEATPQFLVIWSQAAVPGEQRRVVLDLPESQFLTVDSDLRKAGFRTKYTVSVRTDVRGVRHFSSLFSNQDTWSLLVPAYTGSERFDMPQWDVSVAAASKLADPLEKYRGQLTQIKRLSTEQQESLRILKTRAIASYQVGELESALADLDFLLEKNMKEAEILQYRTLALARLGRKAAATESLKNHLAQSVSPEIRTYVQIQVAAWLGDSASASEQLQQAVTTYAGDTSKLYNIACASAMCSRAFTGKDESQARHFADQTLAVLGNLVSNGFQNATQLKSDPDFASLHGDDRFAALLQILEQPAFVSSLWRKEAAWESRLLSSVSLESLTDRLAPLLAQDWRPFSIAVATSSVQPSGNGGDESSAGQTCSLVLHRPVISESARETLALKQAAAVTALLRLNASDEVWPLFSQQPDVRVRSDILHRLVDYGISFETLQSRLKSEPDGSSRAALIQGLGELTRADLLTEDQKASLVIELSSRYRDDPHPGAHSATEWSLRQCGAADSVAAIDRELRGADSADRRWSITSQGQTMVLVEGNTFLQGSPLSEASEQFRSFTAPGSDANRFGRHGFEELHRTRIAHRFWISTKEVTRSQWRVFSQDVGRVIPADDHKVKQDAPTDDSPMVRINWYEATKYCNWLSDQAGIAQDQWCYEPNSSGDYGKGMRAKPGFQGLGGYRLPTEAEWELACRAGTRTAYSFGESAVLLGNYSRYYDNSGLHAWPVGELKPNSLGLFDMHGNVSDWCQDWYGQYPKGTVTDPTGPSSGSSRVCRGGRWGNISVFCRSAHRHRSTPDARSGGRGFRVLRSSVLAMNSPKAGLSERSPKRKIAVEPRSDVPQ
jgi:formylglycine-generating enzyme required for sulfatase activity/serine/threonine protein kinase/tetratricopeptide (TPR) repeat protein